MEFYYHALLEPEEDGGVFVRFLDFGDIFTEGANEEEALYNAAEALSVMLAFKLEYGQPIPEPSPGPTGTYPIALDAKTQAALLVHFIREKRPPSEIARAAAAMGKRLILPFK